MSISSIPTPAEIRQARETLEDVERRAADHLLSIEGSVARMDEVYRLFGRSGLEFVELIEVAKRIGKNEHQ
jgi:hypothetical protein